MPQLPFLRAVHAALSGLRRRFAASQRAATAVEYGLLAALIAVAGVGAFFSTGTQLTQLMLRVVEAFPIFGAGGTGGITPP